MAAAANVACSISSGRGVGVTRSTSRITDDAAHNSATSRRSGESIETIIDAQLLVNSLSSLRQQCASRTRHCDSSILSAPALAAAIALFRLLLSRNITLISLAYNVTLTLYIVYAGAITRRPEQLASLRSADGTPRSSIARDSAYQ